MKVVVIGIGTTAVSVADILRESRNFTIVGFVGTSDEELRFKQGPLSRDYSFLGDHSVLAHLHSEGVAGFVTAIGDNSIREKTFYEASECGLVAINVVSKLAIVNSSCKIGSGVIIAPGVNIGPGVIIEDNVIIESSVVIDVNSVIGANTYIGTGAIIAGETQIGKNVSLGVGVIVETRKEIGKNQVVPAGSIIRENLEGLYASQK